MWRVTWHWLAPVSSAQRLLARRTSRWGLVCRRAICSKQARCRAVSGPLGDTAGDGAMAVGIRNSLREDWALFSSYDTMLPSVRLLLPSTTSIAKCLAVCLNKAASKRHKLKDHTVLSKRRLDQQCSCFFRKIMCQLRESILRSLVSDRGNISGTRVFGCPNQPAQVRILV